MLRLGANIGAMFAIRQMNFHYSMTQRSIMRLSSGLRINGAADDAAGLAISEKMRAQIRGLNMAMRNAQDGISLLQTAEGALHESHAILQRMRELAVKAGNGTYSDDEVQAMQDEINQLRDELSRIGRDTEFNQKPLLDGSYQNQRIQIGANAGQHLEISINDMRAEALGVDQIDLTTEEGADQAIDILDDAINQVSRERSRLGATQNRLGHTINNLSTMSINLTEAESRIRDADIAKEMMEFTKHNILAQAAQMMVAQAMQQQYSVLQLLKVNQD
ncbi:flagellin N-terminal helical domain-containing protein [Amphibacillus xylanus]|uniref:Flagellin n=1 Tax=Amphibacillus xylanus (strain ATCC 51415 / DSM 6626 / JCM 7361 / LMG 17667 / NBRC 15112 / Ep01) TaxID=698758 RepID=K0J470_AMPXN|nr:flagellin [Amphibacillus xylanus NBRC 15112]